DRESLTTALAAALERTLEAHGRRAAAVEKEALDQGGRLFEQLGVLATAVRDTGREQQAALVRVGEAVAAQAAGLGRLQEGEHALVQLQTAMHQNLQALAASGSFDQAVHTLTAAVHLLTARVGSAPQLAGGEAPALKFPQAGAGKGPPGKAA